MPLMRRHLWQVNVAAHYAVGRSSHCIFRVQASFRPTLPCHPPPSPLLLSRLCTSILDLGRSGGGPSMASLRLSSLARGVAASAVCRSSPAPVRTFSTSLTRHQDNPTPSSGGNKPTFAHASRLKDGRALSLDVWSVFKCVITFFFFYTRHGD